MLSPKVTSSATRPSSGISASASGAALLGCVLRRALRDHRAWLGDEHAVPEPAVHDDVPPSLEEIGNGARVGHRDGGRGVAVNVTESEAEAARMRVATHRADDLSGQLHLPRVPRKLAGKN